MVDLGLAAFVTVQARPENLVKAPFGREFLDLCRHLNIHLEFGLQTAIPEESRAIRRANDLEAVSRAFDEVGRLGISHEVSLIYGLPLQTVSSFQKTLDFVHRHGVPTVRCFPLMLHRGTELSKKRDEYRLADEVLDAFDIPFVTSSSSFSREEWLEMRAMADAASAVGGNRASPVSRGGAA
jgi:radical SAM superfamily enzyme